jgi:molecular chaperone GrpE
MTLHPLWLALLIGALGLLAFARHRAAARADHLQNLLSQAQQRLAEQQDDARALQARLDRIQRDHDQQLDLRRRDTLSSLLPIDDHLRRALDHARDPSASASLDALREGIELCARDLNHLWLSCGLTRLNPAPNAPFDPALHEAIASQPHGEVSAPVVGQVFAAGFSLGDLLLRPARVLVHTPLQVAGAKDDAEDAADAQPAPLADEHADPSAARADDASASPLADAPQNP